MRELETARLRLRPFRRGDEDELVRHLGDWEITRQLALNPHPFAREHAEGWIDECLAQPNGHKYGLRLAIEAPDETGLVGGAGVSPSEAGFELGYWIGRAWWGQGYASEAAAALVQGGSENSTWRRSSRWCSARTRPRCAFWNRSGSSSPTLAAPQNRRAANAPSTNIACAGRAKGAP